MIISPTSTAPAVTTNGMTSIRLSPAVTVSQTQLQPMLTTKGTKSTVTIATSKGDTLFIFKQTFDKFMDYFKSMLKN